MPEQAAGRLDVGVVGAGRVGPIIAMALAGAGHRLVGITASGDDSRERVEALLPGIATLDVPTVVGASELVVFAVPDDQLAGLVAGLAATGSFRAGQLVMHTSPHFGTDVFLPALQQGAIPMAVHPAIAFTGTSVDLARMNDAFFAVTAPTPVLPIAMALALEMGGEPLVIDEADRAAYAEAVDTAKSFSAAIVTQATDLLSQIGVSAPGRVLASLVRSSVENALAATSGPNLDVDGIPRDQDTLDEPDQDASGEHGS